jgi:hypothetical protein
VNDALKDENIDMELSPAVWQEELCEAEPLVFDLLSLEHSHTPEFVLENG